MLSYEESNAILSKYGIPFAKGDIVRSVDEAAGAAEKIKYPVVLKVVSPQIVHKTDANVVRVGVRTERELRDAYEEIMKNARQSDPNAKITGVLVQEMVQNGNEVIIGISNDQQFGPVILFGLGGVFVEVLKDVSMRLPPLSSYDATEMVREINGYKVLEGFRGRPKADLNAITDILLKVSKMAIDSREIIQEMDINPLLVFAEGQGAKAVDIRIVTKPGLTKG